MSFSVQATVVFLAHKNLHLHLVVILMSVFQLECSITGHCKAAFFIIYGINQLRISFAETTLYLHNAITAAVTGQDAIRCGSNERHIWVKNHATVSYHKVIMCVTHELVLLLPCSVLVIIPSLCGLTVEGILSRKANFLYQTI